MPGLASGLLLSITGHESRCLRLVEIMMKYCIKECSDQTASLITEDGYALDTFANIYDAIDACIIECNVEPEFIERHFNYLGTSAVDFESSFV